MEAFILEKTYSYRLYEGSVAAISSNMIFAPFTRVRTILQTEFMHPGIKVEDRALTYQQCFLKILKTQGFRSFWRGNTLPCIFMPSYLIIGLSYYFYIDKYLSVDKEKYPLIYKITEPIKFFSVLLLYGLIFYPAQIVSTQLSADIGSGAFELKGIKDCYKKISVRPKEMYQGMVITQTLPYMLIQYSGIKSEDAMWKFYSRRGHYFDPLYISLGIFGIPIFFSVLFYPLETIRNRIMVQVGRTDRTFNTLYECVTSTYKNEGVSAFYKGFRLNCVQLIICTYWLNARYDYGAMN